jgi:hypothetical protein
MQTKKQKSVPSTTTPKKDVKPSLKTRSALKAGLVSRSVVSAV